MSQLLHLQNRKIIKIFTVISQGLVELIRCVYISYFYLERGIELAHAIRETGKQAGWPAGWGLNGEETLQETAEDHLKAEFPLA